MEVFVFHWMTWLIIGFAIVWVFWSKKISNWWKVLGNIVGVLYYLFVTLLTTIGWAHAGSSRDSLWYDSFAIKYMAAFLGVFLVWLILVCKKQLWLAFYLVAFASAIWVFAMAMV